MRRIFALDRRGSDGERGDIVLGWLVKLVVTLAIVGVVIFEAGAVIFAHIGADTAANDASGEAAIAYSHAQDAKAAEAAARSSAEMNGAKLIAFSVSADGKNVQVTVEKTASTLLLHRFSATRSWAVVRTTRQRPVPQ